MKTIEVIHNKTIIHQGYLNNPDVINEYFVDGEWINWNGSIDSLLYTLERNGNKVKLLEKVSK